MIINHAGTEESLPDLADGVSLPILQDTSTEDVFDQYGASKWYIYLVDSKGVPRTIHYSLDLDGERDRLLSDIAALVKEAE
ncbi:MAG: hypothetical protein P8R54_00465 [Myxococcota bacterium]|nr:hypothetical protein [Myxococcota bacterium]